MRPFVADNQVRNHVHQERAMTYDPGEIPGHDATEDVSRSPRHGGPAMSGRVMRFDLKAAAADLQSQPSYAGGEPIGCTLLKEPDLRIVLFAFPAGGRLREHDASGPLALQVLEGSFQVRADGQTLHLSAGDMISLEPAVDHDVAAVEAGTVLLTIGRTYYNHVSEHHDATGRQ
jgi:quercetin dioxygenase-like cupin family protein